MNDDTKAKQECPRCVRDNHQLANYYTKTHFDGTVLHVMGNVEEHDEEVSTELSATFNICCDSEPEELMFIQPHIYSPAEKQNMCSKNVILKTWLLLDSRYTVNVISNVNLLTKIHQVKTTPRIRCNAGMKTTNYKGHLSGYG